MPLPLLLTTNCGDCGMFQRKSRNKSKKLNSKMNKISALVKWTVGPWLTSYLPYTTSPYNETNKPSESQEKRKILILTLCLNKLSSVLVNPVVFYVEPRSLSYYGKNMIFTVLSGFDIH